MPNYEPGDIVTFYFVITDYDNTKQIKAWTDKKQLAEFYMDFHNCPKYRLKKITKSIEEMNIIVEQAYHDEIVIGNIYVKDREKKNGDAKIISIPATQNELNFVSEECATFFATRMGYSYMNGTIPYLKKKYREALDDIFLTSVIKKAVHNRNDKINQEIQFDQLMVLFRSFKEDFGD